MPKELPNNTDQELLAEAKKLRSFSITHAFFIGFLIGIIIYSLVQNTWGFLTLIPLYMIYRLVNSPRNKRLEEVEAMLRERKLK